MSSTKEDGFTRLFWQVSFGERRMFRMSWKSGECFGSKYFATSDETLWNLIIFPLGDAHLNKDVVLRLCRTSTGKKILVESDITFSSSIANTHNFRTLKTLSKTETYIRIKLFKSLKDMYFLFRPSKDLSIKCDIKVTDIYSDSSECDSDEFTAPSVGSESNRFGYSKSPTLNNLSPDTKNIEANVSNTSTLLSTSRLGDDLPYDITLVSKDDSVNAHMNVLVAQSETFADMFRNSILEGNKKVVKVDIIRGTALRGLISYIYTGRLNNLNFELAKDLYHAGEFFSLKKLQDDCAQFLMDSLNVQNIVDITSWSISCNHEKVKEKSIQFISSHFDEVKKTNHWNTLVKDHPLLGVEILSLAMEKSHIIEK